MADLVQLTYQAAAGLYSGFTINTAGRHYIHKYTNWVETLSAGNWTEPSTTTPFLPIGLTTAPNTWARFLVNCYAIWLSILTTLNAAMFFIKINFYCFQEKIAESANDAITYIRTSWASWMSWGLFNPFGGHSTLALIVKNAPDSISGLVRTYWNSAVAVCAEIVGYASLILSWCKSAIWADGTDALGTWWPRAAGSALNYTEATMTTIKYIGSTSYTAALSIVNDVATNAGDTAASSVSRLTNMSMTEVGLLTIALMTAGILTSWLIGGQRFNAFVHRMRNTPFAHDLARFRNVVYMMFVENVRSMINTVRWVYIVALWFWTHYRNTIPNRVHEIFAATYRRIARGHAAVRRYIINTARWAYTVALWFWAHYHNMFCNPFRGIHHATGRLIARGYAAVGRVPWHPNLGYLVSALAFTGIVLSLSNRYILPSLSNPHVSVPSIPPSVPISAFDRYVSGPFWSLPDLNPLLSVVLNTLSSIPLPGFLWLRRAFAVATLVSLPTSYYIAGRRAELPVDRWDIPLVFAGIAVVNYWSIWDSFTQFIADVCIGVAVVVAQWHYQYPFWHRVFRGIQSGPNPKKPFESYGEASWAKLRADEPPIWAPADLNSIQPPDHDSDYDSTDSEFYGGPGHGGSGHRGSGHGGSDRRGSDCRDSDDDDPDNGDDRGSGRVTILRPFRNENDAFGDEIPSTPEFLTTGRFSRRPPQIFTDSHGPAVAELAKKEAERLRQEGLKKAEEEKEQEAERLCQEAVKKAKEEEDRKRQSEKNRREAKEKRRQEREAERQKLQEKEDKLQAERKKHIDEEKARQLRAKEEATRKKAEAEADRLAKEEEARKEAEAARLSKEAEEEVDRKQAEADQIAKKRAEDAADLKRRNEELDRLTEQRIRERQEERQQQAREREAAAAQAAAEDVALSSSRQRSNDSIDNDSLFNGSDGGNAGPETTDDAMMKPTDDAAKKPPANAGSNLLAKAAETAASRLKNAADDADKKPAGIAESTFANEPEEKPTDNAGPNLFAESAAEAARRLKETAEEKKKSNSEQPETKPADAKAAKEKADAGAAERSVVAEAENSNEAAEGEKEKPDAKAAKETADVEVTKKVDADAAKRATEDAAWKDEDRAGTNVAADAKGLNEKQGTALAEGIKNAGDFFANWGHVRDSQGAAQRVPGRLLFDPNAMDEALRAEEERKRLVEEKRVAKEQPKEDEDAQKKKAEERRVAAEEAEKKRKKAEEQRVTEEAAATKKEEEQKRPATKQPGKPDEEGDDSDSSDLSDPPSDFSDLDPDDAPPIKPGRKVDKGKGKAPTPKDTPTVPKEPPAEEQKKADEQFDKDTAQAVSNSLKDDEKKEGELSTRYESRTIGELNSTERDRVMAWQEQLKEDEQQQAETAGKEREAEQQRLADEQQQPKDKRLSAKEAAKEASLDRSRQRAKESQAQLEKEEAEKKRAAEEQGVAGDPSDDTDMDDANEWVDVPPVVDNANGPGDGDVEMTGDEVTFITNGDELLEGFGNHTGTVLEVIQQQGLNGINIVNELPTLAGATAATQIMNEPASDDVDMTDVGVVEQPPNENLPQTTFGHSPRTGSFGDSQLTPTGVFSFRSIFGSGAAPIFGTNTATSDNTQPTSLEGVENGPGEVATAAHPTETTPFDATKTIPGNTGTAKAEAIERAGREAVEERARQAADEQRALEEANENRALEEAYRQRARQEASEKWPSPSYIAAAIGATVAGKNDKLAIWTPRGMILQPDILQGKTVKVSGKSNHKGEEGIVKSATRGAVWVQLHGVGQPLLVERFRVYDDATGEYSEPFSHDDVAVAQSQPQQDPNQHGLNTGKNIGGNSAGPGLAPPTYTGAGGNLQDLLRSRGAGGGSGVPTSSSPTAPAYNPTSLNGFSPHGPPPNGPTNANWRPGQPLIPTLSTHTPGQPTTPAVPRYSPAAFGAPPSQHPPNTGPDADKKDPEEGEEKDTGNLTVDTNVAGSSQNDLGTDNTPTTPGGTARPILTPKGTKGKGTGTSVAVPDYYPPKDLPPPPSPPPPPPASKDIAIPDPAAADPAIADLAPTSANGSKIRFIKPLPMRRKSLQSGIIIDKEWDPPTPPPGDDYQVGDDQAGNDQAGDEHGDDGNGDDEPDNDGDDIDQASREATEQSLHNAFHNAFYGNNHVDSGDEAQWETVWEDRYDSEGSLIEPEMAKRRIGTEDLTGENE